MPRYFFDIRENGDTAPDEVGLELSDLQAAEIEAAQSLADLARNVPRGAHRQDIEIAVRTNGRPLFKAAFIYQLTRH